MINEQAWDLRDILAARSASSAECSQGGREQDIQRNGLYDLSYIPHRQTASMKIAMNTRARFMYATK